MPYVEKITWQVPFKLFFSHLKCIPSSIWFCFSPVWGKKNCIFILSLSIVLLHTPKVHPSTAYAPGIKVSDNPASHYNSYQPVPVASLWIFSVLFNLMTFFPSLGDLNCMPYSKCDLTNDLYNYNMTSQLQCCCPDWWRKTCQMLPSPH